MKIGSVILVFAALMMINELWIHLRDPHPEARRDPLVTAALGLWGLHDLTKNVVLPLRFDFHDLAPLGCVPMVLSAIVLPVISRSKGQAEDTSGS